MPPNKKPPFIDRRVISWLEEIFPDRMPSEQLDLFGYGERTGEQNVIRRLRTQARRQEEDYTEV